MSVLYYTNLDYLPPQMARSITSGSSASSDETMPLYGCQDWNQSYDQEWSMPIAARGPAHAPTVAPLAPNPQMNPATLSVGFDFASGSQPDGTDHLQRLAAMTQGVGKDDSEQTAAPSTDNALYPGAAAYMPGYPGWPNYYQQFGQTLAPPAFGAWPTHCYPTPHWPNYAASKKGRQTYQRYQTSVLEQKFQQSSYVSKKQREELRLQTNLTDRQIKIWFQNRRMKAKKEKQRIDDHGEHAPLLPANPPKGMEDDEKKWMGQWPTNPQPPHPYYCPP